MDRITIRRKGAFPAARQTENREFVSYEYKEVSVDRSIEPLYMDSYRNFGWQLTEKSGVIAGIAFRTLKFRRDRKILNKAELTRLQRQFDACTNEILALEKSKTSHAKMVSLTLGIIGTAFMAGSVFAVTAAVPNIPLCVLLAVPAFIGWIFPYFVYQNLAAKRTQRVEPLIEAKYDEIYEVCEKANGLLH